MPKYFSGDLDVSNITYTQESWAKIIVEELFRSQLIPNILVVIHPMMALWLPIFRSWKSFADSCCLGPYVRTVITTSLFLSDPGWISVTRAWADIGSKVQPQFQQLCYLSASSITFGCQVRHIYVYSTDNFFYKLGLNLVKLHHFCQVESLFFGPGAGMLIIDHWIKKCPGIMACKSS